MEKFNPEQPQDPETPTVQERMANLEFTETPEMKTLHVQLVAEIQANGEHLQALAGQYHRSAESASETTSDQNEYNRQQLKLMVNIARIWLEAGNSEQCLEDLYSAAEYAQGMSLEAEYNSIYDIIDQLTAETD